MTPTEVAALLEAVSWRPGWTITLLSWAGPDGPVVRIQGTAPDARDRTGETTTLLTIDAPVPVPVALTDPIAFYGWLEYRLLRIDAHECREWFRVHGECWSNPHTDMLDEVRR